MIPIHDDNPTSITPVVTIALIAANVLVFLWELTLPPAGLQAAFYAFGLVPSVLTGESRLPADLAAIPPAASIFTSMFLHGGWMHLIGNMLYLWIFGNNIEDACGHLRFVLFYLACGVAAAAAQIASDPGSTIPMVGASGAIGGVLGAYLLLHPRARVLVLIPIFFYMHVARIPALFVLGIWFVLQFVQSAGVPEDATGGVAYWAHIGGFVAGALLILVMRRRGVPLFEGRAARTPPRRRQRGPWG
ncbi:MAG: rhomboid family intramembrane serine protease [Alphaproteobacteria bacterium]